MPGPQLTPIPVFQAQRRVLAAAVYKLLCALVRVLLRSGMPYGVFADLAKRAYVSVATKEFTLPNRRQTLSRVSVITGLSRKETSRVVELLEADAAEVEDRHNRAARVVSGWVRDRRFADAQGAPAALPVEGRTASFARLVKEYSGDVPARAILDELLNVGAVEQLRDGRIRLLTRAYIPSASKADKLNILGSDVANFIRTIDHNVHDTASEPWFQRKVVYDNLPTEAARDLRALTAEQAQALLEKIDQWLATHDRDTNPEIQGVGRKRAGLGIYYFEEDFEKEGGSS